MSNPTGKNQYAGVGPKYTEYVPFKVTPEMKQRIAAEVVRRRATGEKVLAPDIIRESIELYFLQAESSESTVLGAGSGSEDEPYPAEFPY